MQEKDKEHIEPINDSVHPFWSIHVLHLFYIRVLINSRTEISISEVIDISMEVGHRSEVEVK